MNGRSKVCGVIGFQGRFSAQALESGLAAIAHRGPDDQGRYFDPKSEVGLGHARLSIIDLSPLGHQPMFDPSGQVVIVFNGEIYNFPELRGWLQGRGHSFVGNSDTEVLVHMYGELGREMLPRLNGIFALAIWDGRERSLLLARDGLGVKPLYLAESPRGIAFCSEIKGLLHLVPECRRLDPAAIRRYLTYLWCPGEGTPLAGVRKLPPGHAVEFRAGQRSRSWTWYRLPSTLGRTQDLTYAGSVEGTADALREAVRRQLVADVPVGAFLSGGLDSSAVVAFARESVPSLRCFTIEAAGGPEEGEVDDLPYARRVASHLGVRLESVRIAPDAMARDLESMVWHLDEPLGDPAPLNVRYISELARSQGIKVLLSGAGGDDLFTGYRRHRALQAERLWRWLPAPVLGGLEAVTGRLDQRRTIARRLSKAFRGSALSADRRLAAYFEWVDPADVSELFLQRFPAGAPELDAPAPMLDFLAALPPSVSPLERMLALEQRFFLADHNLMYTDKMSMAVGVEVRVPFLDPDLVDHASRIPSRFKQRRGIGKWALKRAMEPFLPHDVIYRPKAGFTAPIRKWIRGELRPMVLDALSSESVRRRGLFSPEAVARLIKANDDGRVDANHSLFALMCLELWCRAFLDRTPPSSQAAPTNGLRS
jgi:asparagine synthase (glutamine-hydrolysing)